MGSEEEDKTQEEAFLAKPQVCLPIVYPHILCEFGGNTTSNQITSKVLHLTDCFCFLFSNLRSWQRHADFGKSEGNRKSHM